MLVDFARGPSQTPIIQGLEFFNYLNVEKLQGATSFSLSVEGC
jgi:hypothetical protein